MIYNKAVGRCVGLVGKLFGHSFHSRENHERRLVDGRETVYSYVSYDVCVRCGATVHGSSVVDEWGEDDDDEERLPIPTDDGLRVNG